MEPLVEAARFWLPLRKESEGERPVGKLMLSIELVPHEQAALLPAGEGHAEPNSHPTLPPPPGQLEDAKIYKWLYRILGPKVRVRVRVKVRVSPNPKPKPNPRRLRRALRRPRFGARLALLGARHALGVLGGHQLHVLLELRDHLAHPPQLRLLALDLGLELADHLLHPGRRLVLLLLLELRLERLELPGALLKVELARLELALG